MPLTDSLRGFLVRERVKSGLYIIRPPERALTSHFIIAWYDDCCQNRLHGNIRALD